MRVSVIRVIALSMWMFVGGISHMSAREDFDIADNIIATNNKKLEKEGFYCFGSGGAFPGTIRLITLKFNTQKYKFTSVEEARNFFTNFFKIMPSRSMKKNVFVPTFIAFLSMRI
jgi:hypothetical protein